MPHVIANDARVFYDLTGPADAPVVVFAHSLGTASEIWDDQVRALAGRYRCLRYDLRGHGRSEVVDTEIRITDLARDLAGLLDALAIEEAHVVGLSIGGLVAQAFASESPARTRTLTVVASAPQFPPAQLWTERAALIREKGMGALVESVLVPRWFTEAFAARAPEKIALVRAIFLQCPPVGYAVACGVLANADLRESARVISAPTLLVFGTEDSATPVSVGEDLATRIPNAKLVVVPGAHLLSMEAAADVSTHLSDFLDRQSVQLSKNDDPEEDTFEAGLANRKAVLGIEHVQRSLENAGEFALPWQDFLTRNAWGEIWGDPALPWKTRSMITLAMMVALHREEEFKLHVRPALKNGVTIEELRSLLMQTAIYAGVPAANAGFRWVKDVLGDAIT